MPLVWINQVVQCHLASKLYFGLLLLFITLIYLCIHFHFASCSCRKTQGVFDKCMKDSLDIDRPDFGYFTRAKVR